MSDIRYWSCPYCNHDATLRDHDYIQDWKYFVIQEPIEGHHCLLYRYVVCPNPKCRKFTLSVGVYHLVHNEKTDGLTIGDKVRSWDLIPPSRAKTFPEYIPKAIIDDYNEACLIVDLSPKASATLARRCLQGILRDFWHVKPARLLDEIEQIKHKTDSDTWEAIDSVRKVGNIGAHMEKDINLIVDVEPNEAQVLINLIEILIKDWYVAREERKNRLVQIKTMADQKDEKRKNKSSQPTDAPDSE